MNSCMMVCGAAFEELSQSEMITFESAGPGSSVLSSTTWACAGVSTLASIAVTITIAVFQ